MKIKRFDLSTDRSLQAWNAADELIVENCLARPDETEVFLYNDRFGYLACQLAAKNTINMIHLKSQQHAIKKNVSANGLKGTLLQTPFEPVVGETKLVLLKMPKSLELYEYFLAHVWENFGADVEVVAGFMTRHFTPKYVEIASKYFENVEQSQAKKKARVLVLTGKKADAKVTKLNTIEFGDKKLEQYPGVFSAGHIDYATQFLLENLPEVDSAKKVMDLASGNGVIAGALKDKYAAEEIHVLDDAFLAIESSKLNLKGDEYIFHYDFTLTNIGDDVLDMVVTNPPFHFEHDINIQIPVSLFKQSFRCLKSGGQLLIVANQHLNYKTHLVKIFDKVEILNENEKFVIYKCVK